MRPQDVFKMLPVPFLNFHSFDERAKQLCVRGRLLLIRTLCILFQIRSGADTISQAEVIPRRKFKRMV